MPTPDYITAIRSRYGSGPLLLPGVSGVVLDDAPLLGADAGAVRLLLTRRSDTGRWSLPSGIVEPGEQPADTLVREVWEETRVRVLAERLVLLSADEEITYPNGDRCQFISMTFRCRYLGGEAQVGDDESTDVGWFALDALPELDGRERVRLECALGPDEATRFYSSPAAAGG